MIYDPLVYIKVNFSNIIIEIALTSDYKKDHKEIFSDMITYIGMLLKGAGGLQLRIVKFEFISVCCRGES